MNIQKIIAFVLTLSLLTAATCAYAEPYLSEVYLCDETADVTYIVELEGGGTIERTSGAYAEMSAELPNINTVKAAAERKVSAMLGGEILNEYAHIMNGFAIEGTADDMARLKSMDCVKNVYISRDRFVTLENTPLSADESNSASSNANASNENSEYTGKGTVIAVIDNEFDINHEVFSTPPTEPAWSKEEALTRISGTTSAKDVDDVYKSEKIPFAFDYAYNDANTYDSVNDHGTYVAGIAAGACTDFRGRASDAQLVLMKVAKDNASTISDVCILAALDDCAALNVDVINMSLGSPYGFSDSPDYDNIFNELNNMGILVSASAGNNGVFGYENGISEPYTENPDYGTIALPASLNGAVAVAAAAGYAVFCGETRIEYAEGVSARSFADNAWGTYDYVLCGYGREDDFSETDTNGKIAVCKRGKCSFAEMALNARESGAVGLIIINTDNSVINAQLGDVAFPCIMISKDSGSFLEKSTEYVIEIKASDTIADFSSRGAATDLRLKPDISGFGIGVYSAIRGKTSASSNDSYAVKSGTSMAAPAFAGSAAAVLESVRDEYGTLSETETMNIVRQKLCSAAIVISDGEIPISPRSQGAGFADIRAATETPAVLYDSEKNTKCELGEITSENVNFQFTVKNLTSSSVTYTLSSDIITDAYKTDKNGSTVVCGSEMFGGAELAFECGNTVTIAGNSSKVIGATLTIDAVQAEERSKIFKNGFFVEGFIYLESGENPTLSVPFMGFRGDWGAVPIFAEKGKLPTGADGKNAMIFVRNSETKNVRRLNYGNLSETVYAPREGFDQLWFFVCNMRNIKQLTIYINKGDSGKTVIKASTTRLSKKLTDPNKLAANALPSGSFGFSTANKLGVGKYTIRFEAVADYSGAKTQVYETNFTIDAEAPRLEDAFIADKGTISVLYIKGADDSGETSVTLNIEDDTIEAESVTGDGYSAFSLGGRSLTDATANVSDPAGNSISESFVLGNGYNATYTENSALVSVECFDAWLLDDLLLNNPKSTSESGNSAKTFVWDDFMRPIYTEVQQ